MFHFKSSLPLIITAMTLLTLPGLGQGGRASADTAPAGAISRENPLETVKKDWDQITPMLDFGNSQTTHGESVLLVGHRLASVEEYAKNVKEVVRSGLVKDTTFLMDQGFEKFGLGGLEFDINPWMEDGRLQVQVLHDAIPGGKFGPKVTDYLHRNTLEKLITHFIEKKHYSQGRRLFIEIKVTPKFYWTHPGLDKTDEALIGGAYQVLHDLIDGNPDRQEIWESLSFVSFNYYALEKIWQMGNDAGISFKTFLILSTNMALYRGAAQLWRVPVINEFVWNLAATSPFLHGIWFDPTWVQDFSLLLNGVNERRDRSKLNVLELQMGTYQMPFPKFLDWVKKDSASSPGLLREVTGLIFDIRAK